MPRKRIGDMLIERGLITESELEFALEMQKQTHEKIGEILMHNNIVSPEDMARTLASQLEVDFIDLDKVKVPMDLSRYVGRNTARSNHVVPVQLEGDTLYVAMDDPLNYYAIDEVRKATRLRIVPMIATRDAVTRTINTLYGNEGANQAIEEIRRDRMGLGEATGEEVSVSNFDYVISSNNISDDTEGAPTIRLVNSIIERAATERASRGSTGWMYGCESTEL